MGVVVNVRQQPKSSKWTRGLDGSYLSEAWFTSPMICVGLEVRRAAARRWCWLVSDHDGEGDVCVVVRSGHADGMAEARALATAAAAAVLDDTARFISGRAA